MVSCEYIQILRWIRNYIFRLYLYFYTNISVMLFMSVDVADVHAFVKDVRITEFQNNFLI